MIGTARSTNGWAPVLTLSRRSVVQTSERPGGGTIHTNLIQQDRVPLRGRGHFGVDGPVARAESLRIERAETRTSEQSWLADGLSRGFAGTRIA